MPVQNLRFHHNSEFGHFLYAVNARFEQAIPGTEYQIVRVAKKKDNDRGVEDEG